MIYNKTFDIQKKICINTLTLLRIPLSIMFNVMLLYEERRLFLYGILFLVIALTDFFDGKLARYYNVQSRVGAVLDVTTDFFFIFTTACVMYKQGLLPVGMIIIILIKFTEFCITSYLFDKKLKKNKLLFFDKIGRFVAVILYSIPIIILILHALLNKYLFNVILFCVYITIGFLSILSFYARESKIIRYKIKI